MTAVDPVDLTARLIRCPSVTPDEAGALTLLADLLSEAGFECTRVDRNGTANLFARWGAKGANKSLGFNGHTDVVPPGNAADWRFDPFSATEAEGKLWGRGACDMKSGVAAFVAAAVDHVRKTPPDGALVLTITGDEEGDATDGTVALLDWMAETGETISHCIVGEPTCPTVMGEMIKNGRRGSMNAKIVARGVQGHAAYPHRAKNPVSALVRLLDHLARFSLDDGNANFDPSTLALTSIDTGNPATNVIPAQSTAALNIRFNDLHTGESLSQWLHAEADKVAKETGVAFDLKIKVSGESFVTNPGWFTDLVSDAVEVETGRRPVLSTSGGTSDARFVKSICPVVEVGLVGSSMHQVDEHVEIAHIQQLNAIYARIIAAYFDDA
ncbi:succinyl-diaminopimelate desuccinylase [Pararhodobacter sp.]|uniref:succinyl-diaminopimelate desuccinylase n=1 Tax=Pararhodobacter sp. TaxID=2127056 RepID=UPI002AFF113E|nr:succinyl-diaminopimelate desuccinylase [Pararhodobacter sp.]